MDPRILQLIAMIQQMQAPKQPQKPAPMTMSELFGPRRPAPPKASTI